MNSLIDQFVPGPISHYPWTKLDRNGEESETNSRRDDAIAPDLEGATGAM